MRTMASIPVIAVFDVGKTNKKLVLFDEQYRIVFERAAKFIETVDEDGDACENLESLRLSVFDSLREVYRKAVFDIRAINFCTYGASFVYIDEGGNPVAPLYNYLKPYPEALQQRFYATYGGEERFSIQTASPVLGSLNSGMQLYRLRHQKPELFAKTAYALHLPQYMSYIITGHICSDLTSIGCHTNLWDFNANRYHEWVAAEGVLDKLAPIEACDSVQSSFFPGNNLKVGIGMHDSSAALIPYLMYFQEPFVLLSTGTWCISLNPFNTEPLTVEELHQDCLCYLTYKGTPVKAARVFSGYEHEVQTKRIAAHFQVSTALFRNMEFNPEIYRQVSQQSAKENEAQNGLLKTSAFGSRHLADFANAEIAYHQLMADLVLLQIGSTSLVLKGSPVKRIFVDGGFSNNKIFMNGLAAAFSGIEVYAASMPHGTALGAALVLHQHWNNKPMPANLIDLEYYHLAPTNAWV